MHSETYFSYHISTDICYSIASYTIYPSITIQQLSTPQINENEFLFKAICGIPKLPHSDHILFALKNILKTMTIEKKKFIKNQIQTNKDSAALIYECWGSYVNNSDEISLIRQFFH